MICVCVAYLCIQKVSLTGFQLNFLSALLSILRLEITHLLLTEVKLWEGGMVRGGFRFEIDQIHL